jgi:hypothetical protein
MLRAARNRSGPDGIGPAQIGTGARGRLAGSADRPGPPASDRAGRIGMGRRQPSDLVEIDGCSSSPTSGCRDTAETLGRVWEGPAARLENLRSDGERSRRRGGARRSQRWAAEVGWAPGSSSCARGRNGLLQGSSGASLQCS